MGDREEGEGKWETGKRDRGKWEKKNEMEERSIGVPEQMSINNMICRCDGKRVRKVYGRKSNRQ